MQHHTNPYALVSGPTFSPPVWYALTVPPQKERATVRHLEREGIYSFFPDQTRCWHVRGRKVCRDFPIISGVVYSQWRQEPRWFALREKRRLITGVYSSGGQPMAIPVPVIKHLQGLTVEAEALREARAEMMRIRKGDKARIIDGPLKGFLVDVDDVRGGQLWFDSLIGKGSADLGVAERIVP